jgi:NitT/TauT family transport system permease protein
MALELVNVPESPLATAKVVSRSMRASRRSEMSRFEAGCWSAAGVVLVLGVWISLTSFHIVPAAFLPSPFEVVWAAIAELTTKAISGNLLQVHILASLKKFFLSYCLSVTTGVTLGLAMGRYRWIDRIVSPIFDALRFIPPIAWVPFSILWFGTGIVAPTMIVFVAAFAPCVVNAQRGVVLLDPILLEATKTFGARPFILFWRILIPGALPQIIAGMRIGAGLGWQSLVAAELIVGNTGLGYAMTQSVQSLDTPTLIVCMISIGAIGATIDYGLGYIERRSQRKRGL